jgi:cell division protein FtsW
VHRQLVLMPLAAFILASVSLLSPKEVRRLAVVVFIGSLVLLVMTLTSGVEINGAQRWVSIAGFSLQPSEFVKTSFIVVAAWMFSQARLKKSSPGNVLAGGLFLLVAALLLMQPDVGMAGGGGRGLVHPVLPGRAAPGLDGRPHGDGHWQPGGKLFHLSPRG